ncbi:MAG: alpha/beta hydrolase [Marinilabiliaceae bacterium]
MRHILLFLFLILILPLAPASAQGFTLAAEYAKQVRRYPSIQPYVPDVAAVSVSLGVTYSSPGGCDLSLDVFRPVRSDSLLPPLVLVHGGGWQSGSRSLDAPLASRLAQGGVCVFCVDYRLSPVAPYPAAVVDVNSALAWVAAHADSLGVDISRLTVAGSSAGGQIAALVGASNCSFAKFLPSGLSVPKVSRVVDIDGVLAFIHPDSSEGVDRPGRPSSATLWLGAPMSADSALWREASPLSHVGEWSAPRFLFINSGQRRFSAGQAEAVQSLRSLGKSVDVRRFDDSPHTFWLFLPWADDVASLIINEMRKKF